jgi:hypothetical protein
MAKYASLDAGNHSRRVVVHRSSAARSCSMDAMADAAVLEDG